MKKSKFIWKCIHCKKTNIETFNFQFEVSKEYDGEWKCKRCGKTTKIYMQFRIYC